MRGTRRRIYAGFHRGYTYFFLNCSYYCPALKLYGYASESFLKKQITRILNKRGGEKDVSRFN